MAIIKPRDQASSWRALMAASLMMSPIVLAPPPAAAEPTQSEAQRRSQSVGEAMELLRKGDEAYLDTDYRSAVEAFAGAREMLPNVPATAELHQAATDRYATASVEHARTLKRRGDMAGAIAAVERVLDPEVSPRHPAARRMLDELNDPVRTNPALTPEHADDIDRVRRGLYTAEGAFHLGKFDEAERHYQRVLRIDPHNRAARRGMERTVAAKKNHQDAAYDQTRAAMLAEVDAEWETQLPFVDEVPEFEAGRINPYGIEISVPVSKKIERIIIPNFRLEQANIQEALELLRIRARENDNLATDPARRGININLITRADNPKETRELLDKRINLQLNNASISAILRYICDATGTDYTTDDFSVIVRPNSMKLNDTVTRTFRVPPDFLGTLSTATSSNDEPADVFAPTPQAGLLPQRLGIREALEANGVPFTDGTSVSLSNNVLRVTHTPSALDAIEQLVNAVTETEPVSVVTRVTMLRVEERRLEELGFDWLLGNFKLGGGGGDSFGISGGTQGNAGSLSDLDPVLIGPMNPITAGNRSGNQAINADAFLSGIGRSDALGATGAVRAPGVLSISGVMNNTTAQMILRGLNQKTGIDTMQQPSVVSRNGQASTIELIREFMYPTEYEPPEIPQTVNTNSDQQSPVTPSMPTAFETRDVGMKLEVLPLADASRNYIELTLAPEFVDFDGFINYGTPITNIVFDPILGTSQNSIVTPNEILQPVFSIQRLNTQVTVADGSTLVLGGLLNSRVENVEDKTPILGDLPVVGRFFQSKASQNIRTAIIFFVNVELIDPTGRPFRDR